MDENESEETKKREEELINSCCSFQSRLGPPEYRRWRRIHGLQLPLHPQQVMGWIVLVGVGAATFLVLIPAMRTAFRECLLVALATLFCVHIFSHVAALLLDPADPELRRLKVRVAVPEFDRSKHAHVIENGRCHLCNIKTKGPRTKHCSVCNKCIDRFDHHCKWLNHCIGGRNYAAFLICVVTAVGASLLVVGISVLEIIYYHTDPDLLAIYPDRHNGTSHTSFLPESVFLGVVSVLALLAATTAGLLLHLCLFHCYISLLGITTYEYIRNYRQGAMASTFFPYNFTCKKLEVMSNHVGSSDQVQSSRRSFKFDDGCCHSRPEDTPARGCCRATCTDGSEANDDEEYPRKKVGKLERQDTDPEFIDRVVKPFVITLTDEKGAEGAKRTGRICRDPSRCNCLGKQPPGNEPTPEVKETNSSDSRFGKMWQFCSDNAKKGVAPGGGDPIGKIKCNQIRPTALEKLTAEGKLDKPQPKVISAGAKLPELGAPARKLHSATELREISTVLDLAEQPNFALQRSMRPRARRGRKKILVRRPRSPSLSPIRESGLSNPGSPRATAASPLSTPVFTRASSPEMSTIFLSNPNSPCSSDEDTSSSSPTPRWTRTPTADPLETPQLPRKTYPGKDPVFVVKRPKFKAGKWIDVEIRDGI